MSGSTTTAEVAKLLGCEAKTLRRFLRASPSFRSVGQGRKYQFTETDIRKIQELFPVWVEQHTRPPTIPVLVEDEDEGWATIVPGAYDPDDARSDAEIYDDFGRES
jgi:helix-turn-helix protein